MRSFVEIIELWRKRVQSVVVSFFNDDWTFIFFWILSHSCRVKCCSGMMHFKFLITDVSICEYLRYSIRHFLNLLHFSLNSWVKFAIHRAISYKVTLIFELFETVVFKLCFGLYNCYYVIIFFWLHNFLSLHSFDILTCVNVFVTYLK